MLIESSTVTNCSPPACTSRSVRPRHGSISASRPWCRWERFSLVGDLHGQLAARHRRRGDVGVGRGRRRSCRRAPTNTSTLPSRMARIASTVSQPCSRGGSKPNSSRSASRNAPGIFSQMPIVRSPWTLLCPRTGAGAGAGPADVAAQQQEVDDLADRRDRVAVLGQPHRPADDHLVGRDDVRDELLDLLARTARSARSIAVQSSAVQVRGGLVEPVAVAFDEVRVEHRARDAWPRGRAAPCSPRRTARGRR